MLLKSKNVAYLGVMLALNQLFIILSSIIETNTLVLFALSAFIVGVVIVEFDVKTSVVFYIASCILGYFLSFNKVEIITYILFFGMYSIVKYAIENFAIKKKHAAVIEFIIKIVYFNIMLLCIYFIANAIISIKLYWWMIIIAELGFIAYDYAFSIIMLYYINKIQPKLKR